MIFSKFKFQYFKQVFLLAISIVLFSCQPKTTEELVSELKNSDSVEESIEIAQEIAVSYDFKAIDLIETNYADNTPLIEETYTNIINYYANNFNKFDEKDQLLAFVFINKMIGSESKTKLKNEALVNIFVSGLGNSSTINFNYELNKLIIKFENSDSEKIVLDRLLDNWKKNKSKITLNSILYFENYSSDYFVAFIVFDDKVKDLVAHFGESVVVDLKIMMQNPDIEVRYAAAEVLIKMIKLHPEAVKSLTDALKDEDLSMIANNYPFYIRLGAKGSEDLLLMTLRKNFNLTIGVDFLNCGNPYIEKGTIAIAKDNGYHVTSNVGVNSGPIWGSGNEEEVDEEME
ncbi:MAG: HEAT repeat domain-containing protein [Bacteroidia bacterium]|nr:HEAT repeat domain-containing protein [Bacteroidia bacterium]